MNAVQCRGGCSGCPYGGLQIKSAGRDTADFVIVGEAPGAQEVNQGEPFVGSSGQLLWDTLRKVGGPERADVFVTNALACRPPAGESPGRESIEACRERVLREIRTHPRKIVVALGNTAIASILNRYDLKITKILGNSYDLGPERGRLVPCIHPAAVLRSPQEYRKMVQALGYAVELYNGQEAKGPGEVKYFVVTPETVEHTVLRLVERRTLAADIETSGLNPRTDRVLALGIQWSKNKVAIFPENTLQQLRLLFAAAKPRWVWHNGKFDTSFLRAMGYNVRVDEDTMLLSYALNEYQGGHGLKELATELLGAEEYTDELKKYLPTKATSFEVVPRNVLYRYLAKDADYTGQLYEILSRRVAEQRGLENMYRKILLAGSHFLQRVEGNGLYVDRAALYELRVELTKKIEAADAILTKAAAPFWDPDSYMSDTGAKTAPAEFNARSPKQLAWMLYVRLKLTFPKGVRSKKDTRADTLKLLPQHPIVRAMLELRKAEKALSTYVDGIEEEIESDGRVHSTYLLHGSVCVTGDTLIWTDQGLRRAAELCPQNEGWKEIEIGVLSAKGEAKTSHTLVTHNRNVVKVSLGLGHSIRCTPEHPFLTERGWVEAKDLQTDDFVFTSFGKNFFAEKGISKELSELIGIYLSDGHIHYASTSGHYSINFSNSDLVVRDRLKALFEKEYGEAVSVTWDESIQTTKVRGKGVVQFWKLLFPLNGAAEKVLPMIGRNLTREASLGLLRGLSLDGTWGVFSTGTKHKSKRLLIRFSSVDRERLEVANQILLNVGVRAKLHGNTYKDPGIRRVGNTPTPTRWQLDITGRSEIQKYIEVVGIASSKQGLAASKILEYPEQRSWGQKLFHQTEDTLSVQVLSVEDAGVETVYDFTVPIDESYTAGGVVVHNTGRLSSRGPNLQNIPRDANIRRVFAAPPGRVLIECDFASHELRCLAHLSGDTTLKQVFVDKRDLHDEVTYAMYPDAREVTPAEFKEYRIRAKAVNFGIAYGRTSYSIAKEYDLSQEQAQKLISDWFALFPEAHHFITSCRNAPITGKILMSPFGRRRRFSMISAENREAAMNEASNFPIQCLLPGSLVWTDKGHREIETIRQGDMVRTSSGYHEVLNTWQRETETDTVTLRVAGCNDTTFTPEHPIWVRRGVEEWSWKRAKDIKVGDKLKVPRILDESVTSIEGIELSEELANVCGWYLAEGHYAGKANLAFTMNLDERAYAKVLCEDIDYLVRESFPGKQGRHVSPAKITEGSTLSDQVISVRVGSSRLGEFLHRHFGNGAVNKSIPSWLYSAPRWFVEALLAAYAEGDGTSKDREGWVLYTQSKQLAYGVQLLLNKYGRCVRVTRREANFGYPTLQPWHYRISLNTQHRAPQKGVRRLEEYFECTVQEVSTDHVSSMVYNLHVDQEPEFCVPYVTHNSLASDLTLLSAQRVEPLIRPYHAKIVNLVHDSILVECPASKAIVDKVAKIIVTEMRRTPDDVIKAQGLFDADAKIGQNWGYMQSWHEVETERRVDLLPALDVAHSSSIA